MLKPAVVLVATLALSASTAAASTGQLISVNGTGAAGVPAGASNAQQQAAYSRALSGAIDDARSKALAVAQQLSLTLGAVQSFTELSSDYLGYCGIGFVAAPQAAGSVSGAAPQRSAAAAPANQLKPIPAKHKKHKRKKHAHRAQAAESACQVEADVTIVYVTA